LCSCWFALSPHWAQIKLRQNPSTKSSVLCQP
ncbi:uncharacterized protein METZ01_LOCUS463566, partial [marine metagenome]